MKNALAMLAKLHARAVKAYGAYLEATPGTQAKIRKWDDRGDVRDGVCGAAVTTAPPKPPLPPLEVCDVYMPMTNLEILGLAMGVAGIAAVISVLMVVWLMRSPR